MYYWLFRGFPKSAFSRLMGRFAEIRAPRPLLRAVIRAYVARYGIDLAQFEEPPGGFPTFNAFFTRPLKAGARPIAAEPDRVACPVDGRVITAGAATAGRLIQAKGRDYSLAELLGDDPVWRDYDGGPSLALYLSPRDYHRIHSPVAGRVTRFIYVPGELWTVSPAGVRSVPRLFARNERLITEIETAFGQVLLVAVGATVVGKIRVVYHAVTSQGRAPLSETLSPPYPLEKGQELGRFELGSTVILLFRPGEAVLDDLQPGQEVKLGQGIGTVLHG